MLFIILIPFLITILCVVILIFNFNLNKTPFLNKFALALVQTLLVFSASSTYSLAFQLNDQTNKFENYILKFIQFILLLGVFVFAVYTMKKHPEKSLFFVVYKKFKQLLIRQK
jgi:hypothetical protein